MHSASRQSPQGMKKRKKEVVLSSQNQIYKYFNKNVESPTGKKAPAIEAETSPPPAKKAKSSSEESGIVTLSSDSDVDDPVVDEDELPPSPPKKRKPVVKKAAPEHSSYFDEPIFPFKDPSTPVKEKRMEDPLTPIRRSALVDINGEKPKKPLSLPLFPAVSDDVPQPCIVATTSQKTSTGKSVGIKYKIPKLSEKVESSTEHFTDLSKKKEEKQFKSPKKRPTSLREAILGTSVKPESAPVIPNDRIKTSFTKSLSTLNPLNTLERVDTTTEPICIVPSTPNQPEPPLKNFGKVAVKSDEVLSEQPKAVEVKKATRRVVRHSNLNVQAETDRLSVASKFEVGSNEILSAAQMDFQSTYKDVETLLEMKTFHQSCPNVLLASQNKRSLLATRYHTNFNFFLSRDNQEIAAIGALRRLSRHLYPFAEDCHTILFRIIGKTNDRMALFRAQEFLDNLQGLHPPCNQTMRDYYWSIMSQHLDDPNGSSRWENVRSLLSDMLKATEKDFENKTELNAAPNPLERTRAALAYIIRLLEEDLLCWVRLLKKDDNDASGPASLLRKKIDVPLMARLLWPQSDIGHISLQCRELIALHISGLESNNQGVLCYTTSLMKMLAIVMQLSDLQLPLKMRLPSQRLSELTREIMNSTESHITSSEAFIASFHSTELRMLISLAVLNRLEPSVCGSSVSGSKLGLKNMLSSVLGMDEKTPNDEVITRFRSRPEEFRRSFSVAFSGYFKLFGAQKTWYVLRERYKKSLQPLERRSPEPIEMFSNSFSKDHLVQDMKQTKKLLQLGKGTKLIFSLFGR